MTKPLDRRLNVYRPGLADTRLQGQVEASAWRSGQTRQIAVPVADVVSEPHADSGLDTQFLFGDTVHVFDEADGFAWVQGKDGYVGYVASTSLVSTTARATHVVRVPRTFIYPAPDMKKPRRTALSMGSRVAISDYAETRGSNYALTEHGEALIADHLRPLEWKAGNHVDVAETLLQTPYLWGGASGFGIDCSGLVQLSLRIAGVDVLRDTDMQAASIGEKLESRSELRRGDLVFWKGHVAIVSGDDEIIHASGHAMMVTREGLDAAIERIGYLYGLPTGFRRPVLAE